MGNVIVLNTTFPHLQGFAIDLAKEGLLERYFHAFMVHPEVIDRFDRWSPKIAKSASSKLRLRSVPPEIRETPVHTPAAGSELLRVALIALSARAHIPVSPANSRLIARRNAVLSKSVSSFLSVRNTLLSSYTASYLAFRHANEIGARAILDYPTAHHVYMRNLRDEEVRKWPEWADTWPYSSKNAELGILDEECERANRVVVGSQFASLSFPSALRHKVSIVPYRTMIPIQPASSKSSTPAPGAALNLLFVGQLTLRKGLPYLIEAIRQFSPKEVQCTMVGPIVGTTRWMRELPPNVQIIGKVNRLELPHYYKSSSALILPSIAEGLPNVILEARAFSLPVITTATGGDEVVENGINGLIIESANVDSIVRAIHELLDTERLQALAECQYSRVIVSADHEPEIVTLIKRF